MTAHELWLIGAGRMGMAFLNGWTAAGFASAASPVHIVEPKLSDDARAAIASGTARLAAPPFAAKPGRFVVLAVKPQMLNAALADIRTLTEGAIVLSIVAGRTIASIAAGLGAGNRTIIRAMPNTPAAIGKGISTVFAGPEVDAKQRGVAERMLAVLGGVVWVEDEALIDAGTAISGSGPAYFFLLVEALADAGVALGLTPETAMRLARETLIGSGALLAASAETPAALRQAVTSPAGTTEAALKVLMAADGLTPLMRRAAEAALARAKELGKS